tara:strand:+ start:398 stop:1066 length:669 start_codon:yes stop_codon:yes gene_type:complete
MSEIKVNKISPASGTTFTIGDSGDTFNIPSGVTLANSGSVTGLPASAISSGTIATARLGSGTASSSTFLRGDSTFASPGGGKVLQVVTTAFNTERSTSSTSYQTMETRTITPSATSSKILVILNGGNLFADGPSLVFSFFRDSTDLGGTNGVYSANDSTHKGCHYHVVDSPSTTSEITYAAKLKSTNGSYTMYFNAGSSPTRGGNAQAGPMYGSLTCIEIGA